MLVKIAVQLGMRKFHVALSIQTAMGWSSSENCKGMRSLLSLLTLLRLPKCPETLPLLGTRKEHVTNCDGAA